MARREWDPLANELQGSLQVLTIKRGISNILDSYTGWYDPFCELIQNALDAVERRSEAEPTYKKKIWIEIDLEDRRISVTDSGTGFSEDEFAAFLAPQVSFKKQGTRGNKGVGATYLAYGFNYLQLGTRSPGYEFVGTIEKGKAWVVDEEETVEKPKIIESKPIHQAFEMIDRGATFSLQLMGTNIFPSNLNYPSATTAKQWAVILLLKTPLGGIYSDASRGEVTCHLRVKAGAEVTELELSESSYMYPHKVISTCACRTDILSERLKRVKAGKDPNNLPKKYTKLNGVYDYWSTADIVDDKFSSKLTEKDRQLIKDTGLRCYGFFCYSTSVWDHFNDELIELRKGLRILRGGLQLSSDSMPQGELHLIPLNKNIGYQHQSHIVAHFERAVPDLGRKGYKPDIVDLAKKVSTIIVSVLQEYRRFLKKETAGIPNIGKEKEVHEWIKLQEMHEEQHPLVIAREDVFLPGKRPLITSQPLNEQDVISLFNQLLAGGVIRGLEVLATNQHSQYDGICRLVQTDQKEIFEYSSDANPLGLPSDSLQPFKSKPLIMEYKYTVDFLIDEFRNEEKNAKDIGVVVAWTMGSKWAEMYDVTSLLHNENIHHRYFHGGTHLFDDTTTGLRAFPVIILDELIDYINDPEAVQDYQAKTYSG